jgi:ribosomal protein L37E
MPLAKCKRCDTLFQKNELAICSECEPLEHNDHDSIRDYLNDNPNATAEQIADNTDVDVKCIMRLIDQGAIASVEFGGGGAKCGQCGEPAISLSKKLCPACLDKLEKKMLDVQRTIQQTHETKKVAEKVRVRDALEQKRR